VAASGDRIVSGTTSMLAVSSSGFVSLTQAGTNTGWFERFEMDTGAGLAVAEYHRDGDTLVIFYTEVPPTLRGRGMGERLVRGVLDEVRRRKLKVVPRCSFVREFVERTRTIAT